MQNISGYSEAVYLIPFIEDGRITTIEGERRLQKQ
jgi:hypothetical protein